MALRKNTGLKDAQANAFAALFAAGSLKIYSGSQPASGNDAASGTLLCTITLPSPAFGASASGVISKTGTWQGTAAATATAGWARIANSGNTQSFDVTVGTTGTDLIIDDAAIVSGGAVVVTAFTYTF